MRFPPLERNSTDLSANYYTVFNFCIFMIPKVFATLKYKTYRSPCGIYELEYPRNWKLPREENILNICPRDEIGAVTISAYSFESKTNEEIIKFSRISSNLPTGK